VTQMSVGSLPVRPYIQRMNLWPLSAVGSNMQGRITVTPCGRGRPRVQRVHGRLSASYRREPLDADAYREVVRSVADRRTKPLERPRLLT